MSQKLNLEGYSCIHDPRALVEFEAAAESLREVQRKFNEELFFFSVTDCFRLREESPIQIIPKSMLMPRTGA
jgi:hypothetical protein